MPSAIQCSAISNTQKMQRMAYFQCGFEVLAQVVVSSFPLKRFQGDLKPIHAEPWTKDGGVFGGEPMKKRRFRDLGAVPQNHKALPPRTPHLINPQLKIKPCTRNIQPLSLDPNPKTAKPKP